MSWTCAALVTAYAIEEPPWEFAAIEPVVIKTPPSGFARNVGFAALSRA